MNNKKLLVASSSKNEAVTQWIIKNQLTPLKFDLLFIDDLLNKYDIEDSLDDNKTLIQWFENNALKYSNETHCLLNRVTYVDKTLFAHFRCEDRDYAQREFEAYLGFAFNSFEKVQNCAINGMCERVYSLPQQWNIISKKTQLFIPNYYWGSKEYCPFKNSLNIVHSTIYNFLNWSFNGNPSQLTGFCFEKPQGEPVFILSVGNSKLISVEKELTAAQLQKLNKILDQIKPIFNYFIFELLIFIDQNKFTFGCINIDLVRSQNNSLFSDFLHDHLIWEFNKCLN